MCSINDNTKSPFGRLREAVRTLCELHRLWSEEMHRDLPKKWEKHGDLVILPQNCFQNVNWRLMGRELWQVVTEALHAQRLARKRRIGNDDFRSSHIDLLYGTDGWVEHVDNKVRYQYDVTKCMFSIGNINEKLRIAQFDCRNETVVDLFAGIGYFTLPYLVHTRAHHVVAIDWNSDAIDALRRNICANNIAKDRCTVIEGDCRQVCPAHIADRVNLGLLPTARHYWLTGCKALKLTGGVLHIHDTISSHCSEGTVKIDETKNETTFFDAKEKEDDTLLIGTTNGHVARRILNEKLENGPEEEKCSEEIRQISRKSSLLEQIESCPLPSPKIHPNLQNTEHNDMQRDQRANLEKSGENDQNNGGSCAGAGTLSDKTRDEDRAMAGPSAVAGSESQNTEHNDGQSSLSEQVSDKSQGQKGKKRPREQSASPERTPKRQKKGETVMFELSYGLGVQCPNCIATFITVGSMNRHRVAEHGNIRKVCPQCNETFKRHDQLRHHIEVDHQNMTYQCSNCIKAFKTKHGLTGHIGAVHQNRTYPCSHCNKVFRHGISLSHHTKAAHQQNITYRCSQCNAVYKYQSGLARHKKKCPMSI